MATKVSFINSTLAQYTDEDFSLLQTEMFNAGIFGDRVTGVMGLGVSQNGTPNMSVNVAIGKALVDFTKSAINWKVAFVNTAIVNVAIASNASGSNRVDAIIVRIDKDANPDSIKSNIGTIERVAGSGVSALTDGAITTAVGSDGWYRLANITVANGAVSILNASIADTRVKVLTSETFAIKDNYSTSVPAGAVLDYSGKGLPSNFLWADGSPVSRVGIYANLFSAVCNPQVFTVTIANPAVFTLTNHGFVAGDQITITTTGGLASGLAVNTTYYVISTGLTSNTFRVALSPEGTAVITTGSQSGVHTLYFSTWGKGDGSTTFNIPDLRSVGVVGRGDVAPATYLDFEPASVTTGTDIITVPSFIDFPYQGQKVRLTTTGGLPAGLATATDYYVIRTSSTGIKLATTQANANASTPVAIDITTQGTGVHTIVFTNVVRSVLGLRSGEDTHGLSVGESASHKHTYGTFASTAVGTGEPSGTNGGADTQHDTSVQGSDLKHNIMQPNVILNKIIKY